MTSSPAEALEYLRSQIAGAPLCLDLELKRRGECILFLLQHGELGERLGDNQLSIVPADEEASRLEFYQMNPHTFIALVERIKRETESY